MSVKTFYSRISCKRGFTLLELVAASIILCLIMTATVSFTLFVSKSIAITRLNSEIHNEMRLMMMNIKRQLIGAEEVEIYEKGISVNLPYSGSQKLALFKFDDDGCYTFRTRDGTGEGYTYMYIENLQVIFSRKVDGATGNLSGSILAVTITNEYPLADPRYDPKYSYTLKDEIWVQNLDADDTDPTNNIIKVFPTPGGVGESLWIVLAD